jgi:hypothetical protein
MESRRASFQAGFRGCCGALLRAYPDCRARAIDKYAFQLSALLKTEAAKSRTQRRTLKQIHEDLKELGFEGSYDRVAAFTRTWREGQTERVSPASKTPKSTGSPVTELPAPGAP